MDFNEVMIQHIRVQDTKKGIVQDGEVDVMFEDFEINPAHRIVKHIKVDSVNDYDNFYKIGKDIDIHFISRQRDYGAREIYAISKPNVVISEGDYILDTDEDELWLCYSIDTFPIRKNHLSYCNQNLRMLRDGKIIDIPCTLSDKTSVYSDGLSKGKRLTLANDQIMITLPINSTTKTIKTGERFIFEHSPNAIYKARRIDFLEKDGIMDIRLRHDRYDSTLDNLELGIADYYKPNNGNKEPIVKAVIDGPSTIVKNTSEYYYLPTSEDVEFNIIKGEDLCLIDYYDYNEIKLIAGSELGNITLQACVGDECYTKDIEITDWW